MVRDVSVQIRAISARQVRPMAKNASHWIGSIFVRVPERA